MDRSPEPRERQPRRRRSGWRRALVAFLVTVTALQLVALACLYGFVAAYEGKVLPNVSVAGVPLTGLTRSQAEAKLRSTLLPLSSGYVTLSLGSEARVLTYRDLGRDYDVEAMLDEAFAVGHTGGPQERSVDGLRSLMNPTDVPKRVTFDPDRVSSEVARVAASLWIEPKNATLRLSKDATRFALARSVAGRAIDVDAAAAAVRQAIDTTATADTTVSLRAVPVAPDVTTQDVQAVVGQAKALAGRIARSDLRLTGAGREFRISPKTIRKWIRFQKRADGSYVARVSRSHLKSEVTRVANSLYIAPRNASLFFKGGAAIGYLSSSNGRRADAGAAYREALAALEGRAKGAGAAKVTLKVSTLVPAITSEEAARVAPLMTLLGTWTTRYVPSERNFYGANIKIPASTIDGDVVAPGEWFDWWGALGPITRTAGYGDGGVIRNGRTEPTGALAGGICSASTTLFNAAARAGLELGQRHNHYYYIDRYPLGLDATVLKGSSGPIQNMTFRNDTGHPILIRGMNTYGHVRFDIYGIPTGRKVSWTKPIVRNVIRAYDTFYYTTSLPWGARERIEVPANGMDVTVSRTVRDKTGKVIHQETFFSHYGRVNGVVLIGRG